MAHSIPVLKYTDKPKSDPLWCEIFGHMSHTDYMKTVFSRPNGEPVNIYNLYKDQTCFLIGRGPSLGEYVNNKEINKMLHHPAIVKYGMNDSPECLDYDCQLYTCTDRPNKFPKQIWKNPNIMKLVSANRVNLGDSYNHVAYRDKADVYSSNCPNIFSVFTYLIDSKDSSKLDFVNSYLSSPAVLYGYHNGKKCTLLAALKIAMLLGFKRIVLLGVDFKMNNANPYLGKSTSDYPQFHSKHNNELYKFVSPIVKEIYNRVTSKNSNYVCEILTAKKIEAMPFIPTVVLKDFLTKEIDLFRK